LQGTVSGPIPSTPLFILPDSLAGVTTEHLPTPEEREEGVIVPVPTEVAVPAFLVMDPASAPVEAIEAGTDADPDSEPPADR